MSEIQRVLDSFPPKGAQSDFTPPEIDKAVKAPSFSEIPDLFFDRILIDYKLNRLDIQALLFLYRQVWCLPNLHKKYGIGQLNDLKELAHFFGSDFNSLCSGFLMVCNKHILSQTMFAAWLTPSKKI